MFPYFLFLFLLSNFLCLKLDIIGDYFVNDYIGSSRRQFKLLIDPTYPFTYIFKPYQSKTKMNAELKPLLFSNLYGNYSGKWSLDTFYFKEENLTIEMKYLDIYYIKENILNIDGVLGLGSYIKQDANIYYNINQTTNNCFNKISTYDRKNKKIIICDTDTSSKLNNFVIDFSYNTFNYPGLITITKLDLLTNNKEIGLNDEVYVGLVPLFISPSNVRKWIEELYFENEKIINMTEAQIIIDKLNYKIYFDEQEYLYNYNENMDLNTISKYMNLEKFEDNIVNLKNKWYFGFDQSNIERVEFNFNDGNIKVFVYSFKYILIRMTLFIIVFGIFIYAFIIVFQKRKGKNIKNETEQELLEM
jgi:hypothetical protein